MTDCAVAVQHYFVSPSLVVKVREDSSHSCQAPEKPRLLKGREAWQELCIDCAHPIRAAASQSLSGMGTCHWQCLSAMKQVSGRQEKNSYLLLETRAKWHRCFVFGGSGVQEALGWGILVAVLLRCQQAIVSSLLSQTFAADSN